MPRVKIAPASAEKLHNPNPEVDVSRVRCSWQRPLRTAWLYFKKEENADFVYERLNSCAWTIHEAWVTVEEQAKRTPRRCLDGPSYYALYVTKLPAATTEEEVPKRFAWRRVPDAVEIEVERYGAEEAKARDGAIDLLRGFGPLKSWEVRNVDDGTRVEVQARFEREADAVDAVKALQFKASPVYKNTNLDVRHIASATLTIEEQMFSQADCDLYEQQAKWGGGPRRKQPAELEILDAEGENRTMVLRGDDPKRVAQALKVVRGIIAKINKGTKKKAATSSS